MIGAKNGRREIDKKDVTERGSMQNGFGEGEKK